jgi:hypothetical protein
MFLKTKLGAGEQKGRRDRPRRAPYASGQAPRVTVPSEEVVEGHEPSAYIASKI